MSANLTHDAVRAAAASPTSLTSPAAAAAAPARRNTVLWLLFAVSLLFYAVLVVQSGIHNLPGNSGPKDVALLDQVEAQANQGVPYRELAAQAQQVYPWWNNLIAQVTSTYFGFGRNGTTEPTRHYATMDPTKKSVLSTHMILGGACIVLGVFQFWPAFRRRYRKAHRAVGALYILSGYTMVGAAAYYLVNTSIANTFQGFTFHLQLWFLVLSTAITQTLGIYHIKKRNVALHFGFQAYTFAAFLSAPLQRYDWAVLGWIYPHLTQGEVNNMVNLMGFWQCLLTAYVVYVWNRESSPVRAQPVPLPVMPAGQARFFGLLALIGVATTVAFYVVWPGLGQWQVARSVVPASTLAADAALFAGRTLQNLVFAGATGAAICWPSPCWRSGPSSEAVKVCDASSWSSA